jgi:hypothetical protein
LNHDESAEKEEKKAEEERWNEELFAIFPLVPSPLLSSSSSLSSSHGVCN